MSDDLQGLGSRGFERLCQALATCILGAGIQAFGAGPDGGREASFRGQVPYPSSADRWNGYGILQAKYKERLLGTGADTTWLRRHIKAELDAWADPDRARVSQGRRPDYLIVATNVPLSGIPGSGGKDKIDKLIGQYADQIALKDWRIWDEAQITTFLNMYPDVRRAFAALITPSEVLAQMRDRLDTPPEVSVVLNVPSTEIQPGEPGCEAAFAEVYEAAGGRARLGQAMGRVSEAGVGWVQHFAGGPTGEPTVICALYDRNAVAVASSVWNELCAVGGGRRGGGTTGAGFPVGSKPSAAFIGADSREVELAGGQWGPGRLVHQGVSRWVWQPKIAFDSSAISDRDAFSYRDGEMDLRLRLAACIPVVGEDDLRITASGRAQMLAAFRQVPFSEVLQAFAERRGLKANAILWDESPDGIGTNNTRFASYQATIQSADQRPAFLANLWFALPGTYGNGLSSIADLRINFDAIRTWSQPEQAQADRDLRVTRNELVDFYTRAWQVTTSILPVAAAVNAVEAQPAGAPRLELYIQNERPENSGKPRPLRTLDLVDLSYYGTPRRPNFRDLSVGITTPLGLSEAKITTLVQEALARMTEDFGFTGAH